MARVVAILIGVALIGVIASLLVRPTPRTFATTGEAGPLPERSQPRSAWRAASVPAARKAANVARVTTLAWGAGPQQVGRRREPEAAHEGPMAIAVGRDGTVWVLDQVNRRVLRRDASGRDGPSLPVRGTAQDVRTDGNGVAVLDRLGAQTLQRVGADGSVREERPLTTYGVTEPGGTTGLFDDAAGGLYIEESLAGQGRRVLHALGSDDVLAGRPSRGGSGLVAASITNRATGELEVRGMDRAGNVRFTTPLSVGRMIVGLPLLDTDRRGNVYVGILHAAQMGTRDLGDEQLELVRMSADGAPLARTAVPHPASDLESFRELAVTDDGAVLWMHALADDSGEAIERIAF